MNKSKLKFLISGIVVFNFLICAEKSFAAIRKTFSGNRGKSMTQRSYASSSSTSLTRPTEEDFPRMLGPHGPRTVFAKLSDEEIRAGLDAAKTLINEGNYRMVPRLEDTLKFMKHSNENFKIAFNSLTYDDYFKTRDNKQHRSRIYVFNKNDSEKGNLYIKFALTKDLKSLSIISYNNDEVKHEESSSVPSISMLLNDPNYTKVNLVGKAVDKALSIIKSRISSHQYFKAPRVNDSLKELKYKRREFRDIILSFEKKHYISGPEKTHPDTRSRDGTVWVFGYNDEVKRHELYIKFLINNDENEVNVLSFHPTDRPLNFFFKELQ